MEILQGAEKKARRKFRAVLPPNRRVLIIDESDSIHGDFARLLRDAVRFRGGELEDSGDGEHRRPILSDFEGFEIDAANARDEAIAMVGRAAADDHPYAMAFADLGRLSGADGVAMLNALWAADRQLEVVVCSNGADPRWSEIIGELGEHEQLLFLSKPCDGREVVQLAHALTRKWSLRRDRRRMLTHLGELVDQRTAELTEVNAQLSRTIHERRELTRSIQETLNPPPEPITVGAMRLVGRCQTFDECGGDWWAYQELPGERLLVAIGDVTGHGVPATMVAAAARGAIGAMVEHCPDLDAEKVLTTLDRVVREVGQGRFWMTGLVAVFDPVNRIMRFANAGHTMPLVRGHADGRSHFFPLITQGNPLGSPQPHFRNLSHELRPGEIFAFYSDGITERSNGHGKCFGERRLGRILRRYGTDRLPYGDPDAAGRLCSAVFAGLDEFAGDAPASDDLTLVICQHLG